MDSEDRSESLLGKTGHSVVLSCSSSLRLKNWERVVLFFNS